MAVGDLAVTLVKKWRETPVQDLRPHAILLETLRAATSAGPTVLLFEDITGPYRELIWEILLYHVTRMPDRRLLVVVGADGPPSAELENGHDPLEGFAPVLRQVKDAVAKKRASWWWLQPLDLRRVREWVGAVDTGIGQQLIAVSGGDDEVAMHNWTRWVGDGYVCQDRVGRWMPTGSDDPLEVSILDVLATSLPATDAVPASIDALGLARQVLEYAALGGMNFSLAAVGRVLSSDRGDVTAEEIEELADLLTPTRDRPWLIETCEHAETLVGGEVTWHWLYRFASTGLAAFLKAGWSIANEGDHQGTVALKLLEAVRDAHDDHPLFFECCYRLARTAENSQEAEKYSARIAGAARGRQLTVRAHVLLSLPGDDELALDQLARTTDELRQHGQLSLSTRVGARSYEMASRIGSRSQRAEASRTYGRTLNWSKQHAQAVPLLEESVRLERALLEDTPGDTRCQFNCATAFSDLGSAYRNLDRTREAIHCLEKAVSLFRRLTQSTPESAFFRRSLAKGTSSLGAAYHSGGRYQEATEWLKDAILLLRGLLDSTPDADDGARDKRDLAIDLGNLGAIYLSADLARDAVELLEEAVLLLRGLLGTDPTNPDYRRQLAGQLVTQSVAYMSVARASDAVASAEEAVALRQALLASDPTVAYHQRELAFEFGSLGATYYKAGRASESIGALQSAISLYRRLVDFDPANAAYQRELGIRLREIGIAFWSTGQAEASRRSVEEAISLLQRLVESDPDNADYRQVLMSITRTSKEISLNTSRRRM